MLGAIIGDTVGSIYEFDNIQTTDFPLFSERSEFTDDSIMSFAVAVSLGGDSDTLACITGGLAEAYYGPIPEEIARQMWSRLPDEFRDILREMRGRFGCPLGDL